MGNLAIDQQYVNSEAGLLVHLNANAINLYRGAFASYLKALESAGPGAKPPVEPDPPLLYVFDSVHALQLVVAYDNAMGAAAMSPGGIATNPTLDFSPAITTVQAVRLTKPVPPVTPQPVSPVGPPQGVNAPSGNPMYYTVTGDILGDGATFNDARGSFVKRVIQTPFGGESYWEKVS
jgi:hypothetical protein